MVYFDKFLEFTGIQTSLGIAERYNSDTFTWNNDWISYPLENGLNANAAAGG
jgi:hypothetical protein